MTFPFIALFVLAYLSGALPWSVWLGKRFLGIDPRSQSDGNPGAANAYRVGGWKLGVAVLILDFLKAFLPVLVARWGLQLHGDQLLWIALVPTVGHAFSIFLGFRGGRGLVTWFGVWAGLTLYEVPLVMGAAAIVASLTIKHDLYRALLIVGTVIVYLLLRDMPLWMPALAGVQLLILAAKVAVYYRTSGIQSLPVQ
jgi:glycerol-3-phosphate acyltransferase PlsY